MRSALLVAALLASGCTYVRPLDTADPAARQALTERSARQSATVTVLGEAPAPVHHLNIGADSTSWLDPSTGALRVVATSEVATVRFPRAERSPVRDLLYGAGIAAVGGALFGAAVYDGPNLVAESRGQQVVRFATFFGTLGAAGGAVAAVDAFSPDRYVPSPTDPTPADSTPAVLPRDR